MKTDRQLVLLRQKVQDLLDDGLIDEDVYAILVGRVALIAAALDVDRGRGWNSPRT